MRNIIVGYSALSELDVITPLYPGATHLALLGACPWLSYFAPSALRRLNSDFRQTPTANTSGEKMRRKTAIVVVGLVLLFGSAGSSAAQVKRVQMHIAGYLCGN